MCSNPGSTYQEKLQFVSGKISLGWFRGGAITKFSMNTCCRFVLRMQSSVFVPYHHDECESQCACFHVLLSVEP